MNLKTETSIVDHAFFPFIKTLIKIVSTGLISGAIILELVNVYTTFHDCHVLKNLNWMFWIGRIALISHGIEGIIAAYYAKLQQKNPLVYSIYTFFVGTVGLLELNIQKEETE